VFDDPVAAIDEYMQAWNANPKPFVWTATVEPIIGKLSRRKQTLEKIQPGCTLPHFRNYNWNPYHGHRYPRRLPHQLQKTIVQTAGLMR